MVSHLKEAEGANFEGLDKNGVSSLYPWLYLHPQCRNPTFDPILKVESTVCEHRVLPAFGNMLRM